MRRLRGYFVFLILAAHDDLESRRQATVAAVPWPCPTARAFTRRALIRREDHGHGLRVDRLHHRVRFQAGRRIVFTA